ncbi:MAG TPA: aminopeptidase N [Acetobacteraceae bacterium]|nr:aminopeptidase N [Acetobacteraceae bacterium]
MDRHDPHAAGTPRETRLADYRPPAYLAETVALEFDLHETATRVCSRIAFRRNPAGEGGPLFLNGAGQPLERIALDGEALGSNRYALDAEGLTIPEVPERFTLQLETTINPQANTELSGLYLSNGAFFTQCEAEGFRRITYFPDRPDVMARYAVTITADATACPVMLSNGNPGAVEALADGRHRVVWTDPHPKPCYLFALVAGDLVCVPDRFRTRSGREVALGIYVRRGDEGRCAHAMRSLKTAMRWDEEVFGLEYDLDVFNIAAVSDFNMGAMENKGLNVFNTRYVLADPATATDSDYQAIESVIAHEYFHNWTGNRVTCRDWFQLSLKEGLTVYRDQEFSMDQGSRAVKRIGDVRTLRAAQFREDAGPLAHPVQPDRYLAIDNFYTATVYNKGAEVIRMIATIIGKAAFRRGMDLYFQRHDNQAVTIEDFVRCMEDASGADLSAFRLWYHQAGTPEVTVRDEYDAAARRYTLTLAQRVPPTPGQPDKKPMVVPVAAGLIGASGTELAATRVLMLTEPEQSFAFEGVAEPPVPSLLRAFSAPVKLSGLAPERLRFLAAHDTDPFVRWDSGQQFATGLLLEMIAGGPETAPPPALVEMMAAALDRADEDHAFAAVALSLPSEAFLFDQMKQADVDGIHRARRAAVIAIGQALRDRFRATYERLTDAGDYRIDGAAIGRRALRNTCLAYLVADDDADGVRRAKAQFDARSNMTDVLAALGALSMVDCAERREAFASFYEAWKHDALVLDKWFAMQATSPLPGTVAEVRALMAHPDFDLRNPNRVRALVGSFAAGNQVRFHSPDGAGYAILADTIIRLDAMNPQVAARISTPLGQWRRVDPARQVLMRAELERIRGTAGLSKNTMEMVSRALG